MASRISPYIDNTGLVFAYDLANIKRSYLGEPTVNYVPDTYGYGAYAYVSGPVDTSTVNEKGDLTTVKRYTITQAVNTARAAIFPSGLTTGVAYTFSFKWKYNGSTTASPSVGIDASKGNPEGGANNNSFTSATTNTVSIGNGWYLSTYTFVFSSIPTGNCMLTFGIVTGTTAGYVGETFDIYEAQFEIKNHKTQYSNGTRSVTQGLTDLTGRSTIDLTNVSFDSNAQMTFDGTDDYAALSGFVQPSNPNNFSVEAVVKLSSHNAGTNIGSVVVNNYSSLRGWIFFLNGPSSFLGLRHHNESNPGGYNVVYGTGINLNQWYHIAATDDGTTVRLYINGVQVTSGSSGPSVNYTGQPIIGQFGGGNAVTNGSIPYVRIFNRALPASEIQQNFNAIKGRYGL